MSAKPTELHNTSDVHDTSDDPFDVPNYCPKDFDFVDGHCVPRSICPQGYAYIPETGRCRTKNVPNYCPKDFDFVDGHCVPRSICPQGYTYIPETGKCRSKIPKMSIPKSEE